MNRTGALLQRWLDVLHPLWHILLIWLLAALLLHFMQRMAGVLKNYIASKTAKTGDARRIDTLSNVLQHTATIVIILIASMLTLGEIGISITPILATAGVAGIAIGFGAQSLVKDFFAGFFLLLENQVSEGDFIEAGGKAGQVEEVTLRHIRIRDYDGSVHFIPNGIITTVTNKSREFAYAIIDITVARHADLDRIFAQIRNVSKGLRSDPLFKPDILDEVEIEGIEKMDDASIVIRCRLKAMPLQQWRLRREFLVRMKSALDPSEETEVESG